MLEGVGRVVPPARDRYRPTTGPYMRGWT
ncbi:hypothetical protein E2C01_090999 [Portunus trituberculatus]|uniref:Uncharacterized protein n=1 Tax=Portunus trituberculatus TaxID=210409 RepID=A0A5B7JMV8_PORTR|nr:hypothetical protein [Portunus trituberculatus]